MKKIKFFSYIGDAFQSIISYKRRNLSLSAGIILGAAIFSSIFFYGSLVNTIAVQDIINDIEAEVIFYPHEEINESKSPSEFAESIMTNEEILDTTTLHGHNPSGKLFYLTSLNLIESDSGITNFPWRDDFEANIFDSADQNGDIIQQIKLVRGEFNFTKGGCLLSDKVSRTMGISINESLRFNMTIGELFIHPNGYTVTTIYYSLINLTITGIFQSDLFGDNFVIFSDKDLDSDLMTRLTEYKLYNIYTRLDYSKLPVNDLQELNRKIDRVIQKVEIQNDGMILGYNMISYLLEENQMRIIVMQLIDTVLYIPAIFLSLILTISGTELSLKERKYEVSSLKSQGASPKQIKQMIYIEVIIIGIIASCIGILLGSIISSIVLSISRFMSVDFSTFSEAFRSINITPVSILGTIFISMGISLITTSIKTKAFIAQEVVEGTTIDKKKSSLFK
ncbi:MAG: FtsX-like permease family protein, partial [Candidatus Heimdallarchaeota archaeon]|nr:FtsX-like permease family protein [Candidatus Heimdallarchaeota archaeon]MCK4876078.1 FtsX-like permease family protein [Candidatus Heimdallarchaeota archaeon]